MSWASRWPTEGTDATSTQGSASGETSLIAEGKVETTLAKAKAVRPLAEKIITKAGKGDLHARRVVLRTITDNEVVTKLFDEVAPEYVDRPGGYTRITKLGPRRGDGAEMAVIELV